MWIAIGTVELGSALAQQGQLAEGIAQMREGLGTLRATGVELARPGLLTGLERLA